VTAAGESILAAYDDCAISELSRHKLVWSSWGPMLELRTSDFVSFSDTGWGVRKVHITDPGKLRLFFLSLLWRAAVTSLKEFQEVVIAERDLSQLKEMVLTGNPEPLDFFPIQLTQLSTLGMKHNHTALAQEKIIPGFDGKPQTTIPIFRFYFDGLIAHYDRRPIGKTEVEKLGLLTVGHGSELHVSTVKFDTSFQRENLGLIMGEAYGTWPGLMDKLSG
jgi:hypothetical protein